MFRPGAINFFNGQWLARFLEGRIRERIRLLGHPAGRMPRIESPATPQNVLSGGDGFELDLLPSVDGAGLFCFEARSGAYQRYAPKYFGVAKLMDIEPARCFMILTAIAPGTCRALGPLFTMTVRHVQNYHAISAGTLSGNFTTAGEQAPHPEPGESSGVPEPNCPPDFLHPQLS